MEGDSYDKTAQVQCDLFHFEHNPESRKGIFLWIEDIFESLEDFPEY